MVTLAVVQLVVAQLLYVNGINIFLIRENKDV